MDSLILEIRQVGKTPLTRPAQEVVTNTTTGQVTILPGHDLLISSLISGPQQGSFVNLEGKNETFNLEGEGFVRMEHDTVTILDGPHQSL